MSVQEPLRPFGCTECGSRYTRQEHLDRHIVAKHRAVKDFICSYCSKGFARRDILRRHELAHVKAENEGKAKAQNINSPQAGTPQAQTGDKRPVSTRKRGTGATNSPASTPGPGNPPPTKHMRVAKACDRCSKSKLRCDGLEPCSRCARLPGIECAYDRPTGYKINQAHAQQQLQQNSQVQQSDTLDQPKPARRTRTSARQKPGSKPRGKRKGSFTSSEGEDDNQEEEEDEESAAESQVSSEKAPQDRNRTLSVHSNSDGSVSPEFEFASLNPPIINGWAYPYSASRGPSRTGSPGPNSWGLSGIQGLTPGGYGALSPALSGNAGGATPGSVYYRHMTPPVAGYPPPPPNRAATYAQNYPPPIHTNFTDVHNNHNNPSPGAPNLQDVWSAISQSQTEQTRALLTMEYPNVKQQNIAELAQGNDFMKMVANGMDIQDPEVKPEPSGDMEDADLLSGLTIQNSAAASLLQLASHTPRESPEPETRVSTAFSDAWPISTLRKGHLNPASNNHAVRGSPLVNSLWDYYEFPEPKVGRLQDLTRDKIVAHIQKVVSIAEVLPSESMSIEKLIPTTRVFDLYIQLFFHHHQTLFPLIHTPTFDPNATPSYLILAVASLGARYAYDIVLDSASAAHWLSEISHRMLQVTADMDQSLLRTVAWVQAFIILLHAGLFSGDKRDLERSQARSGMPITFCRRQGWLKEPEVDSKIEAEMSLQDRWMRWKDREEIKRLGYGTILLDCFANVMWDLECTSLYMEAADTNLPCCARLWEAPNAEAWINIMQNTAPSSVPLKTIISQISDKSKHDDAALVAMCQDPFGISITLTVLRCIGWLEERQTRVVDVFLQKSALESKAYSSLEAGLEFIQDKVIIPPQLHGDLGANFDNVIVNTLALLLHLTALTIRLPLRILQAIARGGRSTIPQVTLDELNVWAQSNNGLTARTTIWHAGQLLGLASSTRASSPLEPFAIFYAALTIEAYLMTQPPESKADSITLDELVDRKDPTVDTWMRGDVTFSPVLMKGFENGLELNDPDAKGRLLRVCAGRLKGLKVWKVGELLAFTLEMMNGT